MGAVEQAVQDVTGPVLERSGLVAELPRPRVAALGEHGRFERFRGVQRVALVPPAPLRRTPQRRAMLPCARL